MRALRKGDRVRVWNGRYGWEGPYVVLKRIRLLKPGGKTVPRFVLGRTRDPASDLPFVFARQLLRALPRRRKVS